MFKKCVELINQILQVLALSFGVGWAVWTWYRSTEPAIRENIECELSQKVDWSRLNEACAATFTLTVKNNGLQPGEIQSARYGIWKRPPPVHLAPNEQIKMITFDPHQLELITQGDIKPKEKGFVREYAPNAIERQDIVFLFKPSDTVHYAFEIQLLDFSNTYKCNIYVDFDTCEHPSTLKAKNSMVPFSKKKR